MNHAELNEQVRGVIATPTLLLMHLTAGRSILTVRSKKTNERLTLRFSRPDPIDLRDPAQVAQSLRVKGKRPIWVSVLKPEGERAWRFIGTLWENAGQPYSFAPTRKNPLPAGDPLTRTGNWIASRMPLRVDNLMESAEWWHEGVCSRCGRRLTVPDSISTGFGPECRKEVGL